MCEIVLMASEVCSAKAKQKKEEFGGNLGAGRKNNVAPASRKKAFVYNIQKESKKVYKQMQLALSFFLRQLTIHDRN